MARTVNIAGATPRATSMDIIGTVGGASDGDVNTGVLILTWSLTSGGPYDQGPVTAPAPTAGGNGTVTATGLDPSTDYYFMLQYDDNGQDPLPETPLEGMFTTATPTASCGSFGDNQSTDDSVVMFGTIVNGVDGWSWRIKYGTTQGGPYDIDGPTGTTTGVGGGQNIQETITGLNSGTTYYYIIEYVDGTGTVFDMSDECSRETTGVAPVLVDVTITKTTSGAATRQIGDAIVSTVAVTADDAVSLTFADPIPTAPAGTTRTWTSTGDATGSAGSGSAGISETLTFAAAGTQTYTITDTVTAAGTYTNTATVTSPDVTNSPLTASGQVVVVEDEITPPPPDPSETETKLSCTPKCETKTPSELPVAPPPSGGGGGNAGNDTENLILCDVGPDGEVLGSALAVYVYDENGSPVGAPTFVDPETGEPYVSQGTLKPCEDAICPEPIQFCFTSTSTGPVDHPGRRYTATLPINRGFALQSMTIDSVNHAANIVWNVADADGSGFAADVQEFIQSRVNGFGASVSIGANLGAECVNNATFFDIVIECIRVDRPAPDLIEFLYDGGEDLIVNPAYNEPTPLDPPVAEGNYGFRLLARQDDPGPFPGNQPAARVNCTDTANRGWETNDFSRTFEIWGANVAGNQNVTPTPRGTPVQEIASDGPTAGQRSTIWQTFVAPTTGMFNIRLVHGARELGEEHIIALSVGDTDHVQDPGALIYDATTPAQVTSSGGATPGPWTQFNQSIELQAGTTYTLSLSTTNPRGSNRGGLFTDMRAFISEPDQRETSVNDDETCVVTTEETVNTTDCQLWAPRCVSGEITSWQNVETGSVLTNEAFWGQVPAPECCTSSGGEGESGSVSAGNLVHTYAVCGVVGGIPQTLQRLVITDQAGGAIAQSFIGPEGGPVTPSSFTIGACVPAADPNIDQYETASFTLCFDDGLSIAQFDTYFVVRHDNVTNSEVSRVQQWRNPVTGDVTTTQPAGNPVACEVESQPSVQVVESEEMGCADGVPYSRRRTGFFDEQGQLLATVHTWVDSALNVLQAAPVNFTLGGCAEIVAGIEIGFAPLGCTFDVGGEVTGRVFASETVAEGGGPSTYRMVHFALDGTVTDPYVGTWSQCQDGTEVGRYDVQTEVAPGCADGVMWNRATKLVYDTETGLEVVALREVAYIDKDQNVELVQPTNFILGSCANAQRVYRSTVETVENGLRQLTGEVGQGVSIPEGATLVAWSVRHRSGTVVVQADPDGLDSNFDQLVTLDPGEVISFDAGDDPTGWLEAGAVIDSRDEANGGPVGSAGGSARVTYQYRMPGDYQP